LGRGNVAYTRLRLCRESPLPCCGGSAWPMSLSSPPPLGWRGRLCSAWTRADTGETSPDAVFTAKEVLFALVGYRARRLHPI